MAITTYATLQSAITNWLGGRSDIAAARITECISLFEASANRRLRVRQMDAYATLTASSGSATLPTDYLEVREVNKSGTAPLKYQTSSYLATRYPVVPSTTAQFYTIAGDLMLFYPIEDGSYVLLYAQKIPALSDSATTNWLLTAHPDLYLFGSLAEMETLLANDTRVPMWIQRRDAIYDEIEKLSNRTRYNSGVSVAVVTETP